MLAAPHVFFVLRPGPFLAAALATPASAGFAASLLQQERLMAVTPPELSGHALGLHSSGMLTMQGVGAALAGAAAQLTSPGTAMTVIALASIAVTVSLAPGLRPARPVASAPRTA